MNAELKLTKQGLEKVVSVVVDMEDKAYKDSWSMSDCANELNQLITSSGGDVIETVMCHLYKPTPNYFIGKGKAEEIALRCIEKGLDAVIFSEDLTSTQQRNLEEIIGLKVVDRTQLILDIFSQRAHSGEGKVQVELAQLTYLLPRLSGKGIMLSRLGGGIGTRGPGEQKLEVDRRRIRKRISKLKSELTSITNRRQAARKSRQRIDIPTVALIGYTNAGKSTLMNALTDADVLVMDKLFATLDPTSRKFILPTKQKVIFIDTVGFLHKLPHHLIDAFKATLEEVINADILVHVLDASHTLLYEHRDAVYEVLKKLGVHDKPVITALNKIDLVDNPYAINRYLRDFEDAVSISALKKENLDELIDKLTKKLTAHTQIHIFIPHGKMALLHMIHTYGQVIRKEYKENGILIEVKMPQKLADKVEGLLRAS